MATMVRASVDKVKIEAVRHVVGDGQHLNVDVSLHGIEVWVEILLASEQAARKWLAESAKLV